MSFELKALNRPATLRVRGRHVSMCMHHWCASMVPATYVLIINIYCKSGFSINCPHRTCLTNAMARNAAVQARSTMHQVEWDPQAYMKSEIACQFSFMNQLRTIFACPNQTSFLNQTFWLLAFMTSSPFALSSSLGLANGAPTTVEPP